MKIVVINNVTLDGVMQAPARLDEDTRGGFTYGGWAMPEDDQPDSEIVTAMGARMAQSDGLLFGRRTYQDLMDTWNKRGGAFKDALNSAKKYVVSHSLTDPMLWPNSTLLNGNVVAEVTQLKAAPGRELHVMGSGQLIDTLVEHRLIDEFLLITFPVVLGTGRRLFPSGSRLDLELVDAKPTRSGVIVATYRMRS